ncbi:MAG TPA: hypothetical protein VL381_04255 [Rhodocyclaceae bacterium]|nr:hypothetical protein [Rhodocyclaceae bacterium]
MSALTSSTSLIQAACVPGSLGCLVGNDLFALVGALAGTLYAMTGQAQLGWWRRSICITSIVVLAFATTWFVAESMPLIMDHLGLVQIELGRSRMLLAWLIAYFAQDVLLPAAGTLLSTLGTRWITHLGGPSS